MALPYEGAGCAILEFGVMNYFFLAAGFFAGFFAADLAAGFFLLGTDFTSVPLRGLFYADHCKDFWTG